MFYNRKISDDLIYIGASDRSKSLFEGVYPVPLGMSYNSYLMLDERCALFDTVDASVTEQFLDSLSRELGARTLDYLIVLHMEPDHSATMGLVLELYPSVCIVCSLKAKAMIVQFLGYEPKNIQVVGEGDVLSLGRHRLRFISAAMVHWPEVMVCYDVDCGTLFSADAFGAFGALSGRLFADEADCQRGYMDEARRYYTNIVGKYGSPTRALLNKIANLEIKMICPLHGYVWRENINEIANKYCHWAAYKPEEEGVCVCYASIYGNTEAVAYATCARLAQRGVRCVLVDLTHEHYSVAIANCFRFSHIVMASATYNGALFTPMRTFLDEYVEHGIVGRRIGLIENGTWALSSAVKMREILKECKDTVIIDRVVSIKSSAREETIAAIDSFIDELMA